ncbi:MAG: cyclic nucleotide-binding domain-containing protein [Acidobacteria bacterium]|nr:cyclic nucleotide-binding domain-containing protein [Acidobacteriota bacterium]
MDIQTRLRRREIFSHFSDQQVEDLALCLSVLEYDIGDEIFQDREESRSAFLIDEGAVRIHRATPYGFYGMADLGDGEIFGETSFIDGEVRSGSARAEAPSTLVAFDYEKVSDLVGRDQRLAVALYWSFWKSLARKLRTTNDRLAQFFSAAAQPSSNQPKTVHDPTSEFHIDLAAKRAIFQEQKLSNMEINFLATLSKEIQVKPGQILFKEGDEGDKMYVVLEGRVMISKYIPGAGEEALAFLERGDYFGEMALIDRQPRSADAKTSEEEGAVLLAIPREVVEGLLDMHRISSHRLLTLLCNMIAKRLRELNEKLVTWFIFAGGGK